VANALCVLGWRCLPLAQALSIELAATSAISRFVTTRERVMFRAHSPSLHNFVFCRKREPALDSGNTPLSLRVYFAGHAGDTKISKPDTEGWCGAMSALGPGCMKTLTVNLRVEFFVSIASMRKPTALATSVGKRQLRKQFCASLARARFHTASVKLGPRAVQLARPFPP